MLYGLKFLIKNEKWVIDDNRFKNNLQRKYNRCIWYDVDIGFCSMLQSSAKYYTCVWYLSGFKNSSTK